MLPNRSEQTVLVRKQTHHRISLGNALYRLCDQRGHGELANLGASPGVVAQGDGIGHHHFIEGRALGDALDGRAGKNRMRAIGVTFLAPRSLSTSAAFTSVPAVSIMSSMTTQLRPSVSPITCMTSDTLALGRGFSEIPKSQVGLLAKGPAAPPPPHVGGNHDQVFVILLAQITEQNRR